MEVEIISRTVSIGVDLGGTSFSVAWLNTSGKLEHLQEFETKAYRPRDEIVLDLANAILSTAQTAREAGYTVSGVGLGFPGVIDARAGKVLLPPNFGEGWHDFALSDAIKQHTQLETYLINDARAFCFAESRLGAGVGKTDLLGITLGTGVGGGFVLDGQLYLGKYCTAGEFGHQIYDPNGFTCGCGSRGCLEVYTSGPSIVAAATRPLRQGRVPKLREIINNDFNNLSPQTIAQAAHAGEHECLGIFDVVARALAWGITNVTHMLGVEIVVIGGGVAQAGSVLFDPIRQYLETMARMIKHLPEVIPAKLGNNAGLIGAAIWASERAIA